MIKILLPVAMRNFKKDKWLSLLNIPGLTNGITNYVAEELGYDRHCNNADNIYRINACTG